ncbi:DISARM system SNF2-like helicase DrmD [Sorangium sp. So ce131]|uniref:DISARM system SNF2-like helicase DrmD n=1 Tax=Sorangium sp. So ce131 TaxID=3133282 RepID=UPI003F5E4DF3
MTAPSTRSVLQTLTKARLLDLGQAFSINVPPNTAKEQQVELIARSGRIRFRELLGSLGRDELKAACRLHGLDDTGRARPELAARLLGAHGAADTAPPPPIFTAREVPRYAPRQGDIVQVRHRQWLVEQVVPPPAEGHSTLVRLVCLDDDNPGRPLDVLWELELGARVLHPEAHGLGETAGVDPPRRFAAYLHALKWSSVTATDAKLFQAPFRAGIKLMAHQLTPLRKALMLPRANLFIADDVGLGKTIEAGLVAQELLLRQRVDFILIVCPASVCLQWRDEMQRRFGLHFEVMSRPFVGRRRRERGFGVNPWATHARFIISHAILRRPEYRDPLLQHIGERATKSLLILDEAHVAAPASASRYAIDSKITEVIRDIAPRFENRLFLSATPHNGHSNSFSALLEILDPQRFTRGVPVRDRQRLDPVMVRRLKEDLRQLGVEQFPVRRLVQIELTHDGAAWTSRPVDVDPRTKRATPGPAQALGEGAGAELTLARLLARYTDLVRPPQGQGKLVFINLQKRLLSSVEAFYRTLQAHHRAVAEGRARTAVQLSLLGDEDEYGVDDDAIDQADELGVEAASRALAPLLDAGPRAAPAPEPSGQTSGTEARKLLDEMLRLAQQHRGAPDAKALALLDWIRRHQCPAVQVGGASPRGPRAERRWSDRRLIVFTEYGDTKRYLLQLLQAAVEGTEDADQRILVFHGGMSDEQREEVQRAFNAPPDEHPVRILIATDAAREGVNLQGHCADLVHFDIPWNPARLEQRNGRIDRTLQPSPEVRCHYFVYPERPEDLVLRTLVAKVDVIHRELGSISSVLLDRMTTVMDAGIDEGTLARLEAAEEAGGLKDTAAKELEEQRGELRRLQDEIEEAGSILNRSRKVMDFDPALLRDTIDVGLELAGAGRLAPAEIPGADAWTVPDLPASWQDTLDTLRPPRRRDEPFWEFRKRPPQPVVFRPPPRMNSALAHLHLQHPFVQRVLGRFLSQGYSAHDLSRVTVVRTRHDALVRVIGFGRLSLFGRGATRLHDQLVSVAARWIDGKEAEIRPFAEEADRKAVDLLEQVLAEAPELEQVSQAVQEKVRAAAPGLFAALWPHIRDEADSLAHDAERKLVARGAEESEALKEILASQRAAILAEMRSRAQLTFADLGLNDREQEQFRKEQQWMNDRLDAIQREAEREPRQIEALYQIALRRLEPVGLVVLWPETRG